jgi:hypothetical protein
MLFRPDRVEQVPSAELIAAAVRRPELLGRTVAALDAAPREHVADSSAAPADVQDEPALFAFRVSQREPGYWVLSATLDSDWTAQVDGTPASLERESLVRRAVWVPAGEHRVTLRYQPIVALTLFGASLALCAALAWLASRRG